jgi:hypothetical protein
MVNTPQGPSPFYIAPIPTPSGLAGWVIALLTVLIIAILMVCVGLWIFKKDKMHSSFCCCFKEKITVETGINADEEVLVDKVKIQENPNYSLQDFDD